jgi:hypothetical protein
MKDTCTNANMHITFAPAQINTMQFDLLSYAVIIFIKNVKAMCKSTSVNFTLDSTNMKNIM